jgi:hypothetical protein
MLQPFAMIFTLNVSYVNVRKVPEALVPSDAMNGCLREAEAHTLIPSNKRRNQYEPHQS